MSKDTNIELGNSQEREAMVKQIINKLHKDITPIVKKRGNSTRVTTLDGIYNLPFYFGFEDFKAQATAPTSRVQLPHNPDVGLTAFPEPLQYFPLFFLGIDTENNLWITIYTDKMIQNSKSKLPDLYDLMQKIIPGSKDIIKGEDRKHILIQGFKQLVNDKVKVDIDFGTLGNIVHLHGNSADFGLPLLSICNNLVNEAVSILHKEFTN